MFFTFVTSNNGLLPSENSTPHHTTFFLPAGIHLSVQLPPTVKATFPEIVQPANVAATSFHRHSSLRYRLQKKFHTHMVSGTGANVPELLPVVAREMHHLSLLKMASGRGEMQAKPGSQTPCFSVTSILYESR